MTYENVEQAVAALRKHPELAVRVRCGDLTVELRAVLPRPEIPRLGDALASLGPWQGESARELGARLREARERGGSAEPPSL